MERQVAHRNVEDCKHCPINSKAQPPMLKMTRLSVEDYVDRALEKGAKLNNEPKECFICNLIEEFTKALKQPGKD